MCTAAMPAPEPKRGRSARKRVRGPDRGPRGVHGRLYRAVRGTTLFAVAAALGGCHASPRSIAPADLRSVREVGVAPMQPPPLNWADAPYGSWVAQFGAATFLPPVVLIGGMVVLVDLPASIERGHEQARRVDAVMAAASWVPTVEFAAHARDRLRAAHPEWAVAMAPRVTAIPGLVNTELTWHMHNWYGPVLEWCDADARAPAAASERLVVTVALSNLRGRLRAPVPARAGQGHRPGVRPRAGPRARGDAETARP
jgi:hypothetical protein